MSRSYLWTAIVLTILAGGGGCSAGLQGSAGAGRGGDPAQAAARARENLSKNENDWSSLRDLGIALYQLDRPAEAIEPLDHSLRIRPEDRRSLLFRARSFDALDSIPQALEDYGSFLARARGKERETISGRMEQLRRRQIDEDVKRVLAREKGLGGSPPTRNTIAVPDFANPANSDTLRPLAKGLAVMTITDLLKIDSLRVVERERLNTLLDELRLTNPPSSQTARATSSDLDPVSTVKGQQQRLAKLTNTKTGAPYYSGAADGVAGPPLTEAIRSFQEAGGLVADGIAGRKTQAVMEEAWNREAGESARGATLTGFDKETAPRLGRLLGARRIVQGSVLPLGTERIQVGADLRDALTTEEFGSAPPIDGDFLDVLNLQKRLVFEILDLLGIQPSREMRREIERMETRNLRAFLAFCRGLDLEDRGLRAQALEEYRAAASMDPGFGLASRSAAFLSIGAGDLQSIEHSEANDLGGAPPDVGDRAAATGDQLGIVPPFDTSMGIDTRNLVVARGGKVVVEGDVPGGGRKR